MRPAFTIYALHGTPTGYGEDDHKIAARIKTSLFPKPVAWQSDRMAFMEITGGLEFDDYAAIRATVDSIGNNDRIEQVLMYMNCPGGVAAGAPETAAAINQLNKSKPILCVADGYCTSAGYELAAQCSELVVSPTCMVGSVGTRSVMIDDSELFKRLGVRVIPIATGADKTVGLEGVPVDDAAVAVITNLVNAYQRQFILSLTKSPFLNNDKIVEMASKASVWLGDDAVKKGFATRLGTFEQITAELRDKSAGHDAVSARQAIESLRGEQAVEKFKEFVAQASGATGFFEIEAAIPIYHESIAKKFPKLCANALKHDPELCQV